MTFTFIPYPRLLTRSIIRGNLALLFPALFLGVGLYVLTDLFEKLDNFMEESIGVGTVLFFFACKIPSIISQILPVIFLLAVVIQLCLMTRSKEIMALQAGGISFLQPAKVLFICGILAGCTQFCFSEVLGVIGDRQSTLIWQEQVRHKQITKAVLKNIWFKDGDWIVHLDTLNAQNQGNGFIGYKLAKDRITITEIINAKVFAGKRGKWRLRDATKILPASYSTNSYSSITLQLNQDPQHFRTFSTIAKPSQLPAWELSRMTARLSAAGSNVEALKTALNNKFAYAFSLVVMALLGVAIV